VSRLQQLLAEEGYLPVSWTPGSPEMVDRTQQMWYVTNPPQGTWRWPYANTPSTLKAMWAPGTFNVMTRGAVMTFQAVHGLEVDGIVGPKTWNSLISDALAHRQNPWGVTWVHVSMGRPETLSVWWNGQVVLQSLANTGIAQSPTVVGTYPVYLQYRSQTMQGVTPWGEHYSDPGVPYVSYFYGGEAVHGFHRSDYGYPQSLGCVEMPVNKAAIAWKYMHLGTLVTVTRG
jgi:hypothetical protein